MIDQGTYVEHDGRPAVRFTRRYPHPAERVWAAVSEPAGLRHWFPSRVELEPRVGGRIAFRDDPNLPEETSGHDPRLRPAAAAGVHVGRRRAAPHGRAGR